VKEFDCADVVPGCEAHFRAGSSEELIALGTVHAHWAHGLTEPEMPPEVIAAIHAGTRDVA
jgi:predicted small metal-binding protein